MVWYSLLTTLENTILDNADILYSFLCFQFTLSTEMLVYSTTQ